MKPRWISIHSGSDPGVSRLAGRQPGGTDEGCLTIQLRSAEDESPAESFAVTRSTRVPFISPGIRTGILPSGSASRARIVQLAPLSVERPISTTTTPLPPDEVQASSISDPGVTTE